MKEPERVCVPPGQDPLSQSLNDDDRNSVGDSEEVADEKEPSTGVQGGTDGEVVMVPRTMLDLIGKQRCRHVRHKKEIESLLRSINKF